MSVQKTADSPWTPAQVEAGKRVVAASLALDRRTHQWSDWYRKTYHFAPSVDEPTWDEFDSALTAFIEATDILEVVAAYYPRYQDQHSGGSK